MVSKNPVEGHYFDTRVQLKVHYTCLLMLNYNQYTYNTPKNFRFWSVVVLTNLEIRKIF